MIKDFKFSKRNISILLIVILFSVCLSGISIRKSQGANAVAFDLELFSVNEDYNLEISDGAIVMTEPAESEGYCIQSNSIALPAGNYIFSIAYATDSTNKVLVQGNNDVATELELSPYENVLNVPAIFKDPTTNAKIRFYYCGEGTFTINAVTCISDKMIYSDYIFYSVAAVIILILLFSLYYYYIVKKRDYYGLGIILLIIAAGIISVPYHALFGRGIYFGVDTLFHLTRVEGIKDGLLEGQFPVVIWPYMANEYGSIATMYPSLFLYPAAFLRILKVSPVCVYKTCLVLISIFQLFCQYCATLSITRKRKMAVVSTLILAFTVYHIDNLGDKSTALAMGIATGFMMILVAGLYQVFKDDYSKWYYITIGMSGVMNAHIVSVAFCLFICLVFLIAYIKSFADKNRLLAFVKATLICIPVNLCMIWSFIDGSRNNLNMQNLHWTSFGIDNLNFTEVFLSPASIMTLICLAVSVTYLIVNRHSRDNIYYFVVILIMMSVVIYSFTTRIYPWESILDTYLGDIILNIIQYPTRLYFFIAPFLAFTAAVSLGSSYFEGRYVLSGAVFVLLGLCGVLSYKYSEDNLLASDIAMYNHVIGETHATPALADYLPDNVTEEWYNNPFPAYSDYTDGVINALAYEKRGTRIDLTYTCTEEGQYLDMPLFFYNGYRAVDGNGNELALEKGDFDKIRVKLERTEYPLDIHIYYHVSFAYIVTLIISAVSIVTFILLLFRGRQRA